MNDSNLLRFRGYLEGAPLTGPETVHIDVTNVCNLDCVTCWNYGPHLETPKTIEWKRRRIRPEMFSRVLSEVAATGVERIVLSGGGEPFTHPEMYGFIEQVKQRGLRLTVITNGTLCDFARLKPLRVDQILLNMASASPETYVAYHPNQPPSTFDELLAGVELLRGTTSVNLVQVINGLNAHELVQMIELAHQVGARCSFKVGDVPRGTEQFAMTDEQRASVLDNGVPQATARAKQLGVKHNLRAFEQQLRGQGQGASPACFAGFLYSRVSVDGRIFFCCAHIEAGHVQEGPFEDVWRSPKYQALRERMRTGPAFGACARCGKHDMNFAAERELAVLRAEGAL